MSSSSPRKSATPTDLPTRQAALDRLYRRISDMAAGSKAMLRFIRQKRRQARTEASSSAPPIADELADLERQTVHFSDLDALGAGDDDEGDDDEDDEDHDDEDRERSRDRNLHRGTTAEQEALDQVERSPAATEAGPRHAMDDSIARHAQPGSPEHVASHVTRLSPGTSPISVTAAAPPTTPGSPKLRPVADHALVNPFDFVDLRYLGS